MNIELLVIGNEVLSGFTLNTNASFIAQELLRNGYQLTRQTTLPDQKEKLTEGIKEALQRSDLVISTGGLGPTLDDMTRIVAAQLFESEFHLDEEVAKDIAERFGENFPTLKDQATIPTKATVFLNPIGTAPGLVFREGKRTLVLLPGVPHEMKPMFQEKVLPFLEEHFPIQKRSYYKTINLFELPELAVDPFLREMEAKFPEVTFGIYPALGVLTVHLSVDVSDEKSANRILEPAYTAIEARFITNCFDSESETLEAAIHRLFIDNQWTLSIAESCTGGSASSRITQLAGASEYFLGGIISYSNLVKTGILGVPEELIKEKGSVSKEVVEKMVEGILRETGSDFGLAVSGIAGPSGGTPEKPVGTVWCAVCRQGEKPHTWKLQARGTRQMIITRSVNSLFSHLLIYTKETSLL